MNIDQQRQDAQTREEERIIASVAACTVPNPGRLSDLNATTLAAKLERDFYSASLLEALACYFDVTIHEGGGSGIDRAPRNLHKYLLHAHKIGAASVEGVALLTGIDSVDDLVVIKAPQDPDADGLVHEYFVAKMCLNRLKRLTPGFMYAFAAFRCSAPVLDGKTVVEWCTPKQPSVNYVVFEKIPGPDLESEMKAATVDEFVSWFIQIATTEMIGVRAVGWTHYDAHAGNVLNRKIADSGATSDPSTWFWVPYVLEGGQTVYVKSNRVPTFIDYGRAHVVYEGKHYGFFDSGLMREDGLYPDRARPLYDMYKLLGFSLYACFRFVKDRRTGESVRAGFVSSSAAQLFRDLLPLFQFFRDVSDYRSYEEMVAEERDSYYTYSVDVTQAELDTSVQDLLSHIEEQYPSQWAACVASELHPDDLVVTCSGIVVEQDEGSCESTRQAVQSLKFGLARASTVVASPKQPEQVVADVMNSRRRLTELRATRPASALQQSVEYQSVAQANDRSERLLSENYAKLRQELITRIDESVRELRKEGEVYTGLSYDFEISDSALDNSANLRALLAALEGSRLLLIVTLVKAYTVSLATLKRLEELRVEPNPTDASRFLLPRQLALRITKDVNDVEQYLSQITPLTKEGTSLRNGLRDTLDLGL